MGAPFRKCLLMNVSSLSEADLKFDDQIVGEGLMSSQILPALENVERVRVSHLVHQGSNSFTISLMIYIIKKENMMYLYNYNE